MTIEQNISLASYTTIGLGGEAEYFALCQSISDIKEALKFAHGKNLPIFVLGGGSNTVFAGGTVKQLVLKIDLRGIKFTQQDDSVLVEAAAGESWDELVKTCVDKGLAGVECLSGIPGSVGATPVQNVGAYGCEVGETINLVKAIDRENSEEVEFRNADCGFSYRQSRFKTSDAGRYIITSVVYKLQPDGEPKVLYPELQKRMAVKLSGQPLGRGSKALQTVRQTVLELRSQKSMLAKKDDPNARSVGSFFTNPTLTAQEFAGLKERWSAQGGAGEVPSFLAGDKIKVPAGWLIEQAGWRKGYTENGAGISEKHALALVNRGGTSEALLALAEKIQKSVFDKFGVKLEREPIVVE